MTGTAMAPRQAAINHWDEGFQRLVTETVLKPKNRVATAAELALLAEHAIRTGLDPMARQIYGIYRYDKRAGGEVMTLQVGIDGLRTIAERTGVYLGQDGPYWCDEETDWTDVWFKQSPPRAARVVVRKVIAGQVAETPAVAHFDEYAPRKNDGSLMGLWTEKPALMLAKCAEALALRKAFPQDMSGLYTDDEMARTDARVQPATYHPLDATSGVLAALDATASDIPSDLPWDPPADPPAPDPEPPAEDPDRISPDFAADIGAEFHRQGLKVGDFRRILTGAGVSLPDDVGSREKRLLVLQGLTVEQSLKVAEALQQQAKAAA
jgi:phage recombination protein Bet